MESIVLLLPDRRSDPRAAKHVVDQLRRQGVLATYVACSFENAAEDAEAIDSALRGQDGVGGDAARPIVFAAGDAGMLLGQLPQGRSFHIVLAGAIGVPPALQLPDEINGAFEFQSPFLAAPVGSDYLEHVHPHGSSTYEYIVLYGNSRLPVGAQLFLAAAYGYWMTWRFPEPVYESNPGGLTTLLSARARLGVPPDTVTRSLPSQNSIWDRAMVDDGPNEGQYGDVLDAHARFLDTPP